MILADSVNVSLQQKETAFFFFYMDQNVVAQYQQD